MRNKLLLVVLLASGWVHAQSVSLVSGDDYAPYADRNLPEGGMTTELIKKAFAEVKMDAKVDWLPWARGFSDTREGTFAGTFPYLKTEEREKDFLYSDVIIKLESNIFIKAGNKKYNFADLAGMKGSTACVPLGWAPPKKLEEALKSGLIKKAEPKDGSTCVKMLEADRADFFVTDESQGKAAIKASGVPAGAVIMAPVPALADNSLYLIVGKSYAGGKELLAKFNKGLAALRANGTYDKVVKAHTK